MTKQFKINPDLTCPELAGYKLPEVNERSDKELRQISIDMGLEFYVGGNYDFENGVRKGYRKAREKYEFSEEQLKQAFFSGFEMALDTFSSKSKSVVFHNYLKSLRTPRTPIAIEVEMVEAFEMVSRRHFFEPAMHPDGTVKGRWVHE